MLTGQIAGRMRIALTAIITIAALGTLAGVWSYTTATVKNETSVTISESENALIALDLPDYTIEVQQGVTEIPCGEIKNNMPVPLDNLIVSGDGWYSVDDSSLGLGDSTSIILHIPPDKETGIQNYSGLVMADWESGSAEIGFDVTVQVTAPPENNPPPASGAAIGDETTTRGIPLPREPEDNSMGSSFNESISKNDNPGSTRSGDTQRGSEIDTGI